MFDSIRSAVADDLHDIDVEHVYFRYDAEDVLANVDLHIGGGIACLLGRNGAGKSSLLRLLAGVVAPDRGCVRIGGETVHRRPAVRAQVGYLPHRPALYPGLTVADNLRFWGGAFGLSAERVAQRTAALARWIDLGPLLARQAAGLSRGQQQAVALVRTFLRDSPVLLLDEPATGLDGAAVDGLHAYLRERASAGAVVVASTHDYEQAWKLGEQFLMLTPARSVEALAKSCVDRGDEREVELHAIGPGRDQLLRELGAPHRLEGERCIVQVADETSLDALVQRALQLGLRVDGIRPVESGGRWLERWME